MKDGKIMRILDLSNIIQRNQGKSIIIAMESQI